MDIVSDISDVVKGVKQIFSDFSDVSAAFKYSYIFIHSRAASWPGLCRACCRSAWVIRCLSICPAWARGGPWGGPAAVAGIVAGRRVLGAASIVAGAGGAWVPVVRGGGRSAVQPGRVRLLRAAVAVVGPPLRLSSVLLSVDAGRGHGGGRSSCSGSCLRSGLFPNCIAGFQGVPSGFFPALPRRGLSQNP